MLAVLLLAAHSLAPGQIEHYVDPRNSCGAMCLYICAQMVCKEADLGDLIWRAQPDPARGSSLKELEAVARYVGFAGARGVKVQTRSVPDGLAILHLKQASDNNPEVMDHFAALVGRKGEQFVLIDPSRGVQYKSQDELAQVWDGYCVLLSEKAASAPPAQPTGNISTTRLRHHIGTAAFFSSVLFAGLAAYGWRKGRKSDAARPPA